MVSLRDPDLPHVSIKALARLDASLQPEIILNSPVVRKLCSFSRTSNFACSKAFAAI